MQKFTDWLAHHKGVPVITGILLVLVSLVVRFIPPLEFLAGGEVLLHVGVIVAIVGILLGDAL